ncbi:hypothetical protein [Actinomadura macrotermitis]|uniref:Uncharacterized protein n=1 Tax=Actinomadura macrotermitis TaxID=2585200 RepID=A0A7K0BSX6_9ACTN|nr:hypothetical protein [Actinomadura macrotermitis]MQY03992.1 hypothetical protein [Actinomadura macrotermitis]
MKLRRLIAALAVPATAAGLALSVAPAASADLPPVNMELSGPDSNVIGWWSYSEVSGTLKDHGQIAGGSTFTVVWFKNVNGRLVEWDRDLVSTADNTWKNFKVTPDHNGTPFVADHLNLLGPSNG